MSRPAPRVRFRGAAAGPAVRAVALVLHGGRVRSRRTPHTWQPAVARMLPFAGSLARAGGGHGLVVGRVLYRQRGWNGAEACPVGDVEAVLAEVVRRFGPVPVALVGHSLGGRAALRCAGHPAVRAVVALAPWVEEDDPVAQLRGRRVLIVHGDRDRWTDPHASLRYHQRLLGVAAEPVWTAMPGDGHAMLRRARAWHRAACAFTLPALGLPAAGCGPAPTPGQSGSGPAANDTATAGTDPGCPAR